MINSYPNNPVDASRFDSESGISIFNKEDDTWKKLGFLDLKLVSDIENGLIYPELYEKIKILKDIYDKGLKNFSLTNDKPYFYLFNNSDRLIKFTYNGNDLYIDINRSVLFSKIAARSFCVGPKGREGLIGKNGNAGRPAINEKFVGNSNGLIDIDIFIDLPHNSNPISIRGYDAYRSILFQMDLNLDGSYIDEGNYFESLVLTGNNLKIKLNDPTILLKIRQIGSSGLNGINGVNHIIASSYLNEIDVVTEVLLNFDLINNNFIFNKQVLQMINCVFGLKSQTTLNGKTWVGVEVTSRECKDIEIVNPEIILNKQLLDLPSWTPIPGCYDQKRFEFAKFDWYKKYNLPFDILSNPEPKLSSCAVPFWFCGNTGNGPCDDVIDIAIEPIIGGGDQSSSSSSSSPSLSELSPSSDSELSPSYDSELSPSSPQSDSVSII